MEKTFREFLESTDENLVAFVQDVKDGNFRNPSQRNYLIGKVADRAIADIDRLTGVDAAGFEHNIKGDVVQHIENRHGEKGKADCSMADVNDYGRIKYVLDNYDDVRLLYGRGGVIMRSLEFRNSNGEQAPLIIYEKRINGTQYVVEAVPDSKAKKLQIVSAYKTKKRGAGKC